MVPPNCVVNSQNLIASVFSRSLYLTYYQNSIYFLPGVQLAEAQREKKNGGASYRRDFSPFRPCAILLAGQQLTERLEEVLVYKLYTQ